jgi:hypothetical protein
MQKEQKLSKSLQKLAKKASDKFSDDIYFNPKRRKELRESFVKAQDAFAGELEKPVRPSSSIQSAQNNYWAGEFMDQMTKLIDVIDNVVPKKLKEWELSNCKFQLFKKVDSNFLAIKCDYYKGVPKKHKKACHLIPSGLPRKGKTTKCQMIRGVYKLDGFEQIDEGIFTQKLLKFTKVEQTFKGKVRTIKFVLTQRGNIDDNYWLRIK